MPNFAHSQEPFADSVTQACQHDANAMTLLGHIIAEILHSNLPVINKGIISALIARLDQQPDPIQRDTYRYLLEMVVNKTPDDFSL